jgi:hypothetical protein
MCCEFFSMLLLTHSSIFLALLVVGIDTWVRLHARMVIMLPKFNRTAVACRKKFKTIFDAYKEDKLANGISGNNRQEGKFYEALDEWYHQAGQVMKHVSATTTDNAQSQTNSVQENEGAQISTTITTPTSKGKQHFHDRAIDIFEKMAETSTSLMKNFERTNELLQRVDYQFDRLINKL